MKRTILSCVASLTIAAGVGIAVQSAAAADDDATCYGLTAARACVTVNPGGLPSVNPTASSIDECVYLGGDECTVPVQAPVPGITSNGTPPVTVQCYTGQSNCFHKLVTDDNGDSGL